MKIYSTLLPSFSLHLNHVIHALLSNLTHNEEMTTAYNKGASLSNPLQHYRYARVHPFSLGFVISCLLINLLSTRKNNRRKSFSLNTVYILLFQLV